MIKLSAGLDSRIFWYLAIRNSSTRAVCCCANKERLKIGVWFSNPEKGLVRCCWASCAARIKIFEGTQPTLTQQPPIICAPSMMVTLAPPSAALMAQANALEPLPMIATCCCSSMFSMVVT